MTARVMPAALAALLLVGCQGVPSPHVPAPSPAPPTQRPAPAPAPARPVLTTSLPIIPAPASLLLDPGAPYMLARTTSIIAPADSAGRAVAELLARMLRPASGFPVAVVSGRAAAAGDIQLVLDEGRSALGDEGYELVIDSATVRLVARRPAGLFHGVQTIRQLLPAGIESDIRVSRGPWPIRPLHIVDAPRFAWRGAMLDVARHFFTVNEVEQFIDVLALYKMNVLHLHLADDQGWRIEIRSRPLLTSIASATQVGGGAGGFYSREEYARIVRYAQERFITIVPEVDMPGHSNAALVAYPVLNCGTRPAALYTGTNVGWSTLCVGRDSTYAFVDDVIRDLAAMTPGAFIHVGGDEVEGLTTAQYTQFVKRVQRIVASHGKRMVGWEEIVNAPLSSTTLVQQWRSDSVVKAVRTGSRVVLSPSGRAYLDMKYRPEVELGLHWAGYVPVRTSYEWDPATIIPGVTGSAVAGIEAPIWSETLRNITALEYMAMPRLPALAEVGWTPQQGRDWSNFRRRLAPHAARWRLLGINYYPAGEIDW